MLSTKITQVSSNHSKIGHLQMNNRQHSGSSNGHQGGRHALLLKPAIGSSVKISHIVIGNHNQVSHYAPWIQMQYLKSNIRFGDLFDVDGLVQKKVNFSGLAMGLGLYLITHKIFIILQTSFINEKKTDLLMFWSTQRKPLPPDRRNTN